MGQISRPPCPRCGGRMWIKGGVRVCTGGWVRPERHALICPHCGERIPLAECTAGRRFRMLREIAAIVADVAKKTCAICGRRVYLGTGTYYGGSLVHRSCTGIAKIQRYNLLAKKYRRGRKRGHCVKKVLEREGAHSG